MRRKMDEPTGEFTLPAFYTISVLARLGNVSEYLIRRLIHKSGVQRVRAGRTILIPVTEIEQKMPLLFKSLKSLRFNHNP